MNQIAAQIATIYSDPNGAIFKPSAMAGAEAALHTEPVDANTGVPGKGDCLIPDKLGIPNYQADGKNVNAVKQDGGKVRIRPINHRNTVGLRGVVENYQKRKRRNEVISLLFVCILAGCKNASASTSQYLGDISAIKAHGIIGRGVIKLENAINIDGSVVKRLRLINLARGEKYGWCV